MFALAAGLGAGLATSLNLADTATRLWDRAFGVPEAFVLADNTAQAQFSEQLAQRAWRRIFWADNFRARVDTLAPLTDIDVAWQSYIEANADWNANLMISIVGLERYYGRDRRNILEGDIQARFAQLDEALAALRRSDTVRMLRSGVEQTEDALTSSADLARRAKVISDELKTALYMLVLCMPPPSARAPTSSETGRMDSCYQ